ncbi:poly(ADP-ribose) polymerase, putative [Entamoeba histolytica]
MSANLSFQFQYSKTSRGKCKSCGDVISQGEIKVGRETKSRFHDGIEVQWNHLECIENKYNFKSTPLSTMKGWEKLRWEDILHIKTIVEDDVQIATEKIEKIKKINERFWKAKDKLSEVQPKLLRELLSENGIVYGEKIDNEILYDAAADMLEFGVMEECPQCHEKKLENHIINIVCRGNMTEFVKCDFKTTDIDSIKRYKANISEKVSGLDKKKILSSWDFPDDYPTESFCGSNTNGNIKEENNLETDNESESEVPPKKELYGMYILVKGTPKNLGSSIAEWQKLIIDYGGNVVKNVADATVCLSTNEDMKNGKATGIRDAKETLTCLTLEWIDELTDRKGEFMKLRSKEGAEKFLCEGCEWKTEIVKKKYHAKEGIIKETFKPTADSEIMRYSPNNTLGNGTEIYVEDDPVCGWTAYNVVLSKTDLDTGANSVYRMQIVKKGKQYQMMFEWGRIGGTLHNTFRNGSLSNILSEWIKKFKECTGNEWENRLQFKKVGGKYFMQALDTGKDEAERKKLINEETKKKMEEKRQQLKEKAKENYLDPRVSDLIKMIFDTDMMKNTLQNAGLNLSNMPLGKIKIEQMKEAMRVLSKLSDILSKDSEMTEKQKEVQIKDLTAKYYTFVPHVINGNIIPMIDNDEKINKELKLVETMCDVGEAMKLIEEDEGMDLDEMTQIYSHYKSLNTKITALDKDSERYKLLEEYFTNNQETNSWRKTTKLVDIFEIEREGERARYQPHADDPNRQLLYHGSRLTNFVGILSTGLRIAPPEAPCNGYRYGKGLYFANCASKSVSYCTYNGENRGCILFCEVALGKQWETPKDKYMEKPQPGTDSTYALGMVEPDPKDTITLEDGVKVAKGKIISTELKTWNSHSELVVYDVARVNIRYLAIFQL